MLECGPIRGAPKPRPHCPRTFHPLPEGNPPSLSGGLPSPGLIVPSAVTLYLNVTGPIRGAPKPRPHCSCKTSCGPPMAVTYPGGSQAPASLYERHPHQRDTGDRAYPGGSQAPASLYGRSAVPAAAGVVLSGGLPSPGLIVGFSFPVFTRVHLAYPGGSQAPASLCPPRRRPPIPPAHLSGGLPSPGLIVRPIWQPS